jgi:Cupin domain
LQESGAEVISGSLRFRVGGKEQSVKTEQSITIPANTPHHFWNDGEEEVAHSVQWFKPTLKIDRFFETYFAFAQDGKLNEEGSPSFWQLAVMVSHFGDEIRMPAPPRQVQKAIFGLLAPIGRMLGYQPEYRYPHGGAREGGGGAGALEPWPSTAVLLAARRRVYSVVHRTSLLQTMASGRHLGEDQYGFA